MPSLQGEDPEAENQVTTNWDPDSERRCIVCNQPTAGKAICSDPRCAAELADG